MINSQRNKPLYNLLASNGKNAVPQNYSKKGLKINIQKILETLQHEALRVPPAGIEPASRR